MAAKKLVYCAGPLFNRSEQDFMKRMAATLERGRGFETFLPQRDGLEFANLLPALKSRGMPAEEAKARLSRAVFALDVYMVVQGCSAVVANLNGRVPDEGTVVEAALAYSVGKPLVLYKDDSRSSLDGSDNPMLLGLGRAKYVSSLDQLPRVVKDALSVTALRQPSRPLPVHLQQELKIGKSLRQRLLRSPRESDIIAVIASLKLWTAPGHL